MKRALRAVLSAYEWAWAFVFGLLAAPLLALASFALVVAVAAVLPGGFLALLACWSSCRAQRLSPLREFVFASPALLRWPRRRDAATAVTSPGTTDARVDPACAAERKAAPQPPEQDRSGAGVTGREERGSVPFLAASRPTSSKGVH